MFISLLLPLLFNIKYNRAPEQYDVINTIVNPNQRKNLAEVSICIHIINF